MSQPTVRKSRRKVKIIREEDKTEISNSISSVETNTSTIIENHIHTFEDLFEFLKSYNNSNIQEWLNIPWEGKDKQESLLRMFASLGLIQKLKEWKVCYGNFNLNTIIPTDTPITLFYDKNGHPRYLKDKGDSSDLTCIHKTEEKHILATTSKNLSSLTVDKLDIDKIELHSNQYRKNGFRVSLCVCIRDTREFKTMINGIEKTNISLKNILEEPTTISIDWSDLNEAFHQFQIYYKHKILKDVVQLKKQTLCLKMHQQLSVLKTLRMKEEGKKKILWGHIQRSGKSYIIAGCIIQDSIHKKECNYLIITTAPNETIEQQRNVLNCSQLEEFNIIVLDGKNKKPILTNKNIIVCSKQYLQTKINDTNEKTKSIIWLKKIIFEMRFIDESHNGGTTELAQKTLEFYGKDTFTVQITATYTKPVNHYNISKENWILWDLEDIKLCKNIENELSINRLVEKHGDSIQDIISKYSKDSIISEYSKYPELHILTQQIKAENSNEIITDTKDNYYGWSTEACFMLNQGIKKGKIVKHDKFQNEEENIKLWRTIFGHRTKYGIPMKDFPDDIVMLKRIEKICKNSTINSRFIGEGEFNNEPMIIMAFLPQNDIDKKSIATKKLLEEHKIITDYDIVILNSNQTINPKQTIEDARIRARNGGKKGVLVLTGKQCSLGVSIENCDIVLLLNNTMSVDMIYQMMYRCMTEGKNKKCGFVVDLNIHRVVEVSMLHYATLIKPDIHPRDALKYLLQERLINLNADYWMPAFGNHESKINTICENMYEIYSSNTENALNYFLNRLRFKEILLTKEEQKIFNAMFSNIAPTKIQKELIDKLLEDDDEKEKIKKGIEKTKVDTEDIIDTSSETSTNEKEEKQINYMDILKHIIPLICLLTIHDKESSFVEMFELIEKNEYVYNILIDQTKSWWGKSIDSRIIKKFINVYMKYMKDDKETNQIIRTIKELFCKNIKNNRELSNLIDKYLIPQELEKKSNAEVSTPFKLRQEMLDKMPVEFWTSIKKVFEPCSGKGGFILDIIDRFMNGLKETIPNEKERYKTIVEECLYFSDINPTNIFICKLLVDPYNEYKLNYNEGNTLELNIKEKWDIEGFDAVIGNPPYQNSNGASNGTLWDKFVLQSFEIIKTDGYICMVHPSGWRNVNGKFKKLQKKIFEKNMLYLEIHNETDGIATFKAETRYDWYVIQNNNTYTTTKIKFEDCKTMNINIRELEFIPNGQYDLVQKLLATENDEKCEVLYNRSSYGCDKEWVSKTKIKGYIYPCVYTINSKSQLKLFYSNKKDGNGMNKKKLMWSNGRIKSIGSVIDKEGKYGLTQFAYGIVDKEENLENIKKAFDSNKFRRLMEYCAVCQLTVNYKIIELFKKDFWKEFI